MSYNKEIIDLRSRPAFLGEFYGSTPGTAGYEAAKWLNRRVGSKMMNILQGLLPLLDLSMI